MNTNRIFIGTLMNEDKVIGTNVFIKIDNEYILLNDVNTLFDLYSKNSDIKRFSAININTNLKGTKDKVYINKDSLIPYYDKKRYKSLRKIKFDYMLDSRNPIGINY